MSPTAEIIPFRRGPRRPPMRHFDRDISLFVDALVIENERLRAQLARLQARVLELEGRAC